MELIHLNSLKLNDSNPRILTEENFKKLRLSILTFPKMLSIRPIVVNEDNIILGGNMRYRALKEISHLTLDEIVQLIRTSRKYDVITDDDYNSIVHFWKSFLENLEIPYLKAENLSQSELDEFLIKDNLGYGQWDFDILANEFNQMDLEEWGMIDFPAIEIEEEEEIKPKKDRTCTCPECGHEF